LERRRRRKNQIICPRRRIYIINNTFLEKIENKQIGNECVIVFSCYYLLLLLFVFASIVSLKRGREGRGVRPLIPYELSKGILLLRRRRRRSAII
jgi:hypothetical protein